MSKIFLIHDPLRKDREKLYLEEFKTQGIDPGSVEIVPADKSTNNPVINIARAHKECIRRAQAQDLDQVCIMEDDMRFVAPGAYNRFLEVLGMIGGLEPGPVDIVIAGSYEYITLSGSNPESEGSGIIPLKRFSGLFCYVIQKRFYEKFLSIPEGKNIDKETSKVPGASLWMCWPMLALQQEGIKSDNTGKIANYAEVYKKNLKLWKNERG